MQCQETLKRNAVDKHCLRCRNCWDLCCVDCNKIFQGEDFRKHVTCISEAERYQGALYRPKKGHNKVTPQEIWTQCIQVMSVEPPADMDASERHLLKLVSGMSNVPRKLKKFNNICKNSFRNAAKPAVVESLFKKINDAFIANKKPKEEAKSTPKETAPAAAETETTTTSAAPDSTNQQDTKSTTTFRWKKSLKRVLKEQGGEMKVKKARKEVLKIYLATQPTHPLSKAQVKEDFSTLCASSKFVFSEQTVKLK